MKKIIALMLALVMVLGLVACGGEKAPETTAPNADAPETTAPAAEAVTIKVAAIETAYGSQVWADVAAAFTAETGIKVELTTDKNLEDVLSGPMQNGEFPDVVHLATGRPAGLTEQLVKANARHPLDLSRTKRLGRNQRLPPRVARPLRWRGIGRERVEHRGERQRWWQQRVAVLPSRECEHLQRAPKWPKLSNTHRPSRGFRWQTLYLW